MAVHGLAVFAWSRVAVRIGISDAIDGIVLLLTA